MAQTPLRSGERACSIEYCVPFPPFYEPSAAIPGILGAYARATGVHELPLSDNGAYHPRERSPANLRWDNSGIYVLRGLSDALASRIARLDLQPGARVLDYGCALQPYRPLLPDHVDYRGADLAGNQRAHVHLNADGTVPLESGSFDLVLSTQVLEHVIDPRVYLGECRRLLKVGGRLLISTHGMWRYHEDPVDFWRWTGPGLRMELRRAGFDVDDFAGIMGLAGVAIQTLQDATLPRFPVPLQRWYGVLMQRLVSLLDRIETEDSRRINAMVFVALCTATATSDV